MSALWTAVTSLGVSPLVLIGLAAVGLGLVLDGAFGGDQ